VKNPQIISLTNRQGAKLSWKSFYTNKKKIVWCWWKF